MPFPRAKSTCYEAGIHVPMLARWPGRVRPGSVTKELVAHVDLPATWLEAAGVPKPRKMQGRSLLGLLTGGAHQSRTEVFGERNWHDNFDPARPMLELYDLARDPDEFHNLASSPERARVLEDIKRRLSEWMHDTFDYLPPATTRPGEPAGRGWPVSL